MRMDNNSVTIKSMFKKLNKSLSVDDTTLFNNGEEKFILNKLIKVSPQFGNTSGLKLNDSKCTVLRTGSLKSTNFENSMKKNVLWISITAKSISFTNDKRRNIEINQSKGARF